jgi:hypothetical protein
MSLPPVVVLFTGSRTWTDARPIRAELARIRDEHPGRTLWLRHGACPDGGDKIADRAGRKLGYRIQPFPARWHAPCDPLFCGQRPHRRRGRDGRIYCPAAGNRRNQQMVDAEPRPTVCLVFNSGGTKGTADCMHRAQDAGIPLRGRGFSTPPQELPIDVGSNRD